MSRLKQNIRWLAILLAGIIVSSVVMVGASYVFAASNTNPDQISGIYRGASTAVQFDESPPLRDIAPLPINKDDLLAENPEPDSGLEFLTGPQDSDPLVQSTVGPNLIPGPIVTFDGPSNIAGVSPPDPVGDVGPNHYVAMSNLYFAVYDKAGTLLYGPAANNTLWSGFGGDCETDNSGDPIVVYDQLADRWILTQFTASGPTYFNCVAISTSPDPTGTYYRYAFGTGTNFPDYPKYGVWPDAYYISTREFAGASFAGIGAYAVDRAQMIAGNPTPQIISFLMAPGPVPAYNLGDGLLPTDLDGSTLPPAGSPNYFVGSMDNGGPYSAPQDALTIWEFHADFAVPANSTFTLENTVPVTAFDSIFPCSPGSRNCIPQPGTSNKVDILSYRQRPMWRLAYRNFGTHESLVTNQSVEATTNMAGIRWYEIRDPNGTPIIYQEGTYAPGTTDGIHRWMGSIAMDQNGNMALGYSASDATTTFPSSWYTGRLVGDPLGTMPQGEGSIIDGTGSQTGSARWGDYTSMNIDPVDDCTFWYVNQYIPTTSSTGWRLRIGAFRFNECGLPDFTLSATPETQAICAGTDALYTVNVGSIQSFSDPVTLGATGNPAPSTVGFSTNPVVPPGSSDMTIGSTGGVSAGSYNITVMGVAPTSTHTTTVGLDVYAAVPTATTLIAPADGAVDVSLTPTYQWTAVSGAVSYLLEVAEDSGFSTIVYTATVGSTSHTAGTALNTLTTYYWRVTGSNACGTGSTSSTFSFTTQDTPPILLVDDDDNGPDVRAFYTDALDNLGLSYDVWDTVNSDNEPNASQLQPYSTVIWFTGDEFGGAAGPGAAGEAALGSWLDDGNCLFISGQDYYYDRGLTSFMDTYLGVASATSDVAQATVTGAGTVFSGLGPYALSYPFTNWSDIVNADGAPAEVAFTGDQGNAAVNKDSGTYRTTFWGFPWEAIPTAGDREAAMQTFLDWCAASGATGSLEGQVTDADSSDGIDGATVTVVGTGTYSTTTDANGDYSITLPAGMYDVTASAPNYVPVTVTAIDIVTNTTVVQDFALQGSHLTFSPPSIERTVVLSGVVTTTVTVTNTGPLTIEWSVDIGNWGGPITTAVGLNPIAIPASDGSFVRGLYAPSAGLAPADGVAAAPSSAPLVEIPLGTTAYAVEAVNGFFTAFDLDTPETLPNLAPYTAIAFPGAGEVVDGYAYVIDGTTMTQIDLGTGGSVGTTPVTPPPGSHSYSGMALDPTSGTVYVASCDVSTSILYTIDMGTGTTTQVGTITNSPCTIAIAIDGNGDLWGHDIVNDSFLSIDKATAAGTIIGPLGFDANFGQGMGWDAATDQVYLAAFNNGAFQPELRVADRSTGNTTLIGVLGSTSPGGLAQLPWLGTELSTGPGWAYAVPEGGIIPPNSTSTFEVVFDARLVSELGTYTADLDFSGTFVNVVPTMPLTMHVISEAVAGVEVSGDMAGSGAPGDMVMYIVTITNTGNVADTFNLTLSGNSWTTTLLDTSVTLIEGESTTVMVHVTVPMDASDGDTDTVTVTATSVNDDTVTDSTDITTTADVEGYILYLPIIMKP